MDPFELLKKDHKTVSDLFKRIETASGKAKLGVFKQIKSELELHTHIEEAIFYPALENAKETRDLTLEAYEEHKVVKDLLGELEAANDVTDEWEAKLTVLKENVEHHVDEEENQLFGKADDVLTGEEAERLGDRMQAEKVARGGSPAPAEKPGFLRQIANALGVSTPPPETSKASSKKKPPQKATSKKKVAKKTAAKKTGSKATKAKTSKAAAKSTKAAAKRKGGPPSKRKAAGGTNSPASAKKSGAARKRPAARKKTAAKKTRRR